MRPDLYQWAIAPTWRRRHLAADLQPGENPGTSGKAACGRAVMDYTRAVHEWTRRTPHTPAPRLEEMLACEACQRITGIRATGQPAQQSPGLAAYARRANRAEEEVRKDSELLREVITHFGAGHDLSRRNSAHADCETCRLLRLIRHRLASEDRLVTNL